VGPDVDLLIEGHDRFNVASAARIAGLLAEHRPMFFETPVNSDDIPATVELARKVSVPIACGERFDHLRDFAELLSARTISIVQPEVMHLGIARSRKACGIAEAYDALVACHQAQSPLCTAVNAHIHASIPNFLIQENFDDNVEPWTWDLLQGVPQVENGYISVPSAPGIGVALNEAEATRHPYGPTNFLRLFEEGWETRRPG
jgi:galactonate dehydratase